MSDRRKEAVHHPAHYGGKDNPYEAIKVIYDWHLGFSLGNALKYILRAKHKGREREDLEKALFYLKYAKDVREAPFMPSPVRVPDLRPEDVVIVWKLEAPPWPDLLTRIRNGYSGLAYGILRDYLEDQDEDNG